MSQKVTAAAAHLTPVYMDARATVDKTIEYIARAAETGVEIVVFPESFIPGFPLWPAISAPIYNHELFKRFAAQSLRVPGPEVLAICAAAREAGVMVSVGISEATDQSVGCLWNTNLLIGSDGSILNHHRKLVPTFFEKMIWANGDGAGLTVSETAIGRIGALICGENTNPLARYAMIAQGEQIHISSYPPIWPTHEPSANDRYDLASAIRIRAGAHSFEAKVFNLVAAARLDHTAFNVLGELGDEAIRIIKESPKGVSMILGPNGLPIAESTTDDDQLLIETIDLEECVIPKQFHDVVGYYNRFDVFSLNVNRKSLSPAEFDGMGARAIEFEQLEASVMEADPKSH